jgi:hypothetical protein
VMTLSLESSGNGVFVIMARKGIRMSCLRSFLYSSSAMNPWENPDSDPGFATQQMAAGAGGIVRQAGVSSSGNCARVVTTASGE